MTIKSFGYSESSLDFSGRSFTSNELKKLSQLLAKNQTVRHLSMSYCDLWGSDIRALSGFLQWNTTLEILDLSHNHISQKGALLLVDSILTNVEGSGLQELILSDNNLGNTGAEHLIRLLKGNSCMKIQSISLTFNEISTKKSEQIMLLIGELTKRRDSLQHPSVESNTPTMISVAALDAALSAAGKMQAKRALEKLRSPKLRRRSEQICARKQKLKRKQVNGMRKSLLKRRYNKKNREKLHKEINLLRCSVPQKCTYMKSFNEEEEKSDTDVLEKDVSVLKENNSCNTRNINGSTTIQNVNDVRRNLQNAELMKFVFKPSTDYKFYIESNEQKNQLNVKVADENIIPTVQDGIEYIIESCESIDLENINTENSSWLRNDERCSTPTSLCSTDTGVSSLGMSSVAWSACDFSDSDDESYIRSTANPSSPTSVGSCCSWVCVFDESKNENDSSANETTDVKDTEEATYSLQNEVVNRNNEEMDDISTNVSSGREVERERGSSAWVLLE